MLRSRTLSYRLVRVWFELFIIIVPNVTYYESWCLNMMYEQDYIMRITGNLIRFLSIIIFGKETSVYVTEDEKSGESDELHRELLVLLSQGEINKAENLLFDKFNPDDNRQMMVAVDFYQRLNNMDNKFLEENNFSRKEIKEGLKDIASKAGITTYLLQ